ncbi:MAG: 50S ribosomal protein L28 [Sporichthyaceae bacterium]
MSNVCMLTGAKPGFGHAISHSHVRTKRRFDVNIQHRRFFLVSENRTVRLTLSARGLKTVDKIGVEEAVRRIRARGVRV